MLKNVPTRSEINPKYQIGSLNADLFFSTTLLWANFIRINDPLLKKDPTRDSPIAIIIPSLSMSLFTYSDMG